MIRNLPTAAFTTLGCKVNQYETQRILESFEEAGFEVVPFESAADVYVVNSCSVTSIAESKSRYTIRKASRNNPAGKVIVTGCAAQMAINKSELIEGADVLVPNPEKLNTLTYLYHAFPEFERRVREAPSRIAKKPLNGRSRATVKIQDGCNVHCSYCSIPFTRPGMASRPAKEVLDEIEKLVALGYREVILTGVLIGSYGIETGSEGPDFETLVEWISNVSGLDRVRISSIEMPQVSDRLVDLLKCQKVVPHLHIPLQSGDDQVLKDMNRRYTQRNYLDLCERLHNEIPDMSITSDIMVGFPTEDERRFQSTLFVCREARYLKGHVFRFSPRWGTPADQWQDPISTEEKQERSLRVQEITRQTCESHQERFVGRTLRVLTESKETKDGLMHGLTDNYLDVAFVGPSSIARSCVCVRIDEWKHGMLYGEMAPSATSDSNRPRDFLPLRK